MRIFALLILQFTIANLIFGQSQLMNENKMKIAVWDTYVKIETGEVVHFDVLVSDNVKEESKIFNYGKDYLKLKNLNGNLDTKYCQFCHIEEASEKMVAAINQKGYDIIEMETIPVKLQANPTRRQMILYLRGHFDQYRIADFRGKFEEDILAILLKENVNKE